jgi:hypothetical protein
LAPATRSLNRHAAAQDGAVQGDRRFPRRDPRRAAEDVFVNLVEVRQEDWSFGNGPAQQVMA